MFARLCLICVIVLVSSATHGQDWPQYRGPQRDDVSTETGLLQRWPDGGPQLLWTYANAGLGYSGPAVVGQRLYTLGARKGKEYLIALNLQTIRKGSAAEAWSVPVGPVLDWEGNRWSAGPSATPTVDGKLVFALGGMGDLLCADSQTGRIRWRKNFPQELEAEVNPVGGGPKKLGWGFTWSPLVDGDRLICIPGGPKGTVAALNKQSGEVLWRSREITDQAAYASPMLAEIGGVRQYIVLTNQGLAGISTDGKLLWRYERRYSTEVVPTPLIQGSLIYVTVGSGSGGCDLVRVTRSGDQFGAEAVYANKNLANHHGNVVLVKDHVFGSSDRQGWVCQALLSGDIVWSERRVPSGSVTYANGRLYSYSERDGTAHLIEASPAGCSITGQFTIPQQSKSRKPAGRIWTPPVVSGGRLFLRDQELLFCYDIKARGK